MEFAADPWVLLFLMIVAGGAGFVDAIAGGGGLMTVPALLITGLPPHLTLGTNKLCASFGSVTAALTFWHRGIFQPKNWWWTILATAIGAPLGTWFAMNINPAMLNQIIPLVVFACALYALFSRPRMGVGGNVGTVKKTRLRQCSQGTILGFYDGMMGPGTGSFWVVSTMLLYPLDMLRASGVARFMNAISNVSSLTIFILYGMVNWRIGLSMGVCLMVGAWLGARLAIVKGNHLIRVVFIMVAMVMSVVLILRHWFDVLGY